MALKPPKGKPPSQRGNRSVKPARETDELNDIRHIALHEAGHAVSAVVLGFDLRKVDIKRRVIEAGVSVGFTDTGVLKLDDVRGKDDETILRYMVQCSTGPMAEMTENPDARLHGAFKEDVEGARRIAAGAICELSPREGGGTWIPPEELERNKERLQSLIDTSVERADKLVSDHWRAILKVRELLLRDRELSGDEVASIVNWSAGSMWSARGLRSAIGA